jgi:tetratricopeptide (TPR) repeat protein
MNGQPPSESSIRESEAIRQLRAGIDEFCGESGSNAQAADNDACFELLKTVWSNEGRTKTEDDGTSNGVPLPRAFGRFELRRLLGHGGFGVVFLAFDGRLAREVALKIPRPEVLLSLSLRARFLREAQAAALLDHPHVVPVYDSGEIGPVSYITTGYVRGPSLAEWLKDHTSLLSHRCAASIVADLAEAVAHAHSRGVLHRDIKPSNVLLEPAASAADATFPYLPKLADFGLAKRLEMADQETLQGVLLGTPRYMSPEQAAGRHKEVGVTSDVYGLGAMLYELLCGRPPLVGESAEETIRLIQETEPSRAALRERRVSLDLETICLKCLEKEPSRRYQTALQFSEDLRRFVSGDPVVARPISRPARFVRWCRRRPVVAGLTSALILAVAAGTTTALWQWYRAEQHLKESIAAAAEARKHQYQAEQTLLNLAWLVEESGLWGQQASQFGPAVEEKLKEYHQAVASRSDARWAPIRAALHSFEARKAAVAADAARADSEYRLALDAWREAIRVYPEKTDYRRALALCLRNFSRLVRDRSQEAGDSDPRAVLLDFFSNLAADERYGIGFLQNYAELMLDHGGSLLTHNAKADARDSLELGIVAADVLTAKVPEHEAIRLLSGRLWRVLGDVQAAQRDREVAMQSLDHAIEILDALVAQNPENPIYLIELAAAYHRRGTLAAGASNHLLVVESMERAIDLSEKIGPDNARDPTNRLRRAVSLRYLGNSLQFLNRAEEAMAAYEEHGELLEAMSRHGDIIPADEFRGAARGYHQRGILANATEDYEAASTAFTKGIAAFEKAKGFQFGRLDHLYWAECHYFLARRGESSGDKPAAVEHYEKAVEILKDLAERRNPYPAIKDRYRRSVAALAELKQSSRPRPETSAAP